MCDILVKKIKLFNKIKRVRDNAIKSTNSIVVPLCLLLKVQNYFLGGKEWFLSIDILLAYLCKKKTSNQPSIQPLLSQ
jgi:hypothetical protein